MTHLTLAPARAIRPRVLFICGSHNQTTQMHQVARALPEAEAWFSPYFGTGLLHELRNAGLLESTILGRRHARRCRQYLARHGLALDERARCNRYDLVVTCTDQIVPANIRATPLVLVQEGILDPDTILQPLARRFRNFPRWLAGTAATGQSRAWERFCVASDGYREWFLAQGLPADRMVTTGIPNFDNCAAYRNNDFPWHDYVLVCTSDTRETLKFENRRRFLRRCGGIAAGRPLFFKLHPNERIERARREIESELPGARVLTDGSAEVMVANAAAVVCQYSTLIFVAMALGKECYSFFDLERVRRLLPEQNGCAAVRIADVCREVLTGAAGGTCAMEAVG